MGHLRKYLKGVGFVSALLIGGVLGGLMAPLSSDAAGLITPPELTLQVDGLPTTTGVGATLPGTSILGASVACNDASFNACYAINTNITVAGTNGRIYRVQNAPGATARLRIADFAGQDIFSLIGVQFVPTVTNWGTPDANTNEQHILKITMKNKFNGALNVNNATGLVVNNAPAVGQVAFGIRSGGEFRSAPLAIPPATTLFCGTSTTPGNGNVRCSTVGDNVTFTGTGIFNGTTAVPIVSPGAPTANNSLPLSLTVGAGSANTSIVSYNGSSNATLGQVNPTYPRFTCVDPAFPTTCQPLITLTMTATLKGPDSFVLVNGADCPFAICNVVDNTKITRLITKLTKARDLLVLIERFHPSAFLQAIIARINAFLNNFNTTTDSSCPQGAKFIETFNNLQEVIDEIAFVADGAVPADIAPQTGTITIVKNTSQGTSATFDFEITGPSSSTQAIGMAGSNSGSRVVTVNAGTYSIAESPTPGWTLNNVSCGENGDPVSDGVVGVEVQTGGNVTCTFNNNKALSSDNYQKVVVDGLSWEAARAAAKALLPTNGWDLATITSAEEQAFIQTLLPSLSGLPFTDYWIGGTQPDGSVEPGGSWQWINGEGIFWDIVSTGMYANWGAGEPNDVNLNESHVTMDSRYGWSWNDLNTNGGTGFPKGYIAERVSP